MSRTIATTTKRMVDRALGSELEDSITLASHSIVELAMPEFRPNPRGHRWIALLLWSRRCRRPRFEVSRPFHNHRDRVAAAEAEGRKAPLRPAVFHRGEEGCQHPRAAASDRVAKGARPAVYVELFARDAQLAHHCQACRGVCLIVFEHVDVVDGQARLLQELSDPWNRRFHDPLRLAPA